MDAWNKAWLSPWESVQLVVALSRGRRVARQLPERAIAANGLPLTYHILNRRAVSGRKGVPRLLPPPSRVARVFRSATRQVKEWALSGKIVARLGNGELRKVAGEFSLHSIDFEHGRLGGERLLLKRDEIVALATPALPLIVKTPVVAKHPGGRPGKFTWDGAEKALKAECVKAGGVPRHDHPAPDWRVNADAERFLRVEFFTALDEDPSAPSLKRHVSQMLKRIGCAPQTDHN